jgi:hypothetical protein
MRWPFRAKRPDCDVRAFRDPKSGKLTLRLHGDIGFPRTWEEPILTIDVRLDAPVDEAIAVQLRDQLTHLLGDRGELEVGDDARETR